MKLTKGVCIHTLMWTYPSHHYEGLTALDMARGCGEEGVREVLQQYTKKETRTELTEVSQQLWFINHCIGQFSGQNYAIKLK